MRTIEPEQTITQVSEERRILDEVLLTRWLGPTTDFRNDLTRLLERDAMDWLEHNVSRRARELELRAENKVLEEMISEADKEGMLFGRDMRAMMQERIEQNTLELFPPQTLTQPEPWQHWTEKVGKATYGEKNA